MVHRVVAKLSGGDDDALAIVEPLGRVTGDGNIDEQRRVGREGVFDAVAQLIGIFDTAGFYA